MWLREVEETARMGRAAGRLGWILLAVLRRDAGGSEIAIVGLAWERRVLGASEACA